jgi:hypothetical protein
VIGELLGVPVDDRAGIMGLSADVARSLDALPVPADRELVERGRAARRMLGTYFRHLAAARRCKPQDDRLQTPAGFRCGFRRKQVHPSPASATPLATMCCKTPRRRCTMPQPASDSHRRARAVDVARATPSSRYALTAVRRERQFRLFDTPLP